MLDRISHPGELFDLAASAKVALTYSPHWWRGQASDWPLIPTVLRVTDRGAYERGLTLRFKARAGSRYANIPDMADALGWLTLMQHYRLPTRLLDWSESVLVAAYFAVEDPQNDDEDGVIWSLDPTALNAHIHGPIGTLLITDPQVKPIANIWLDATLLQGKDVAALTPQQSDPRTLVQMSSFTIHATRQPLDQRLDAHVFLKKVMIPANAKRTIRTGLNDVGITLSNLFPDLEHLSLYERSQCFCLQNPCPHKDTSSVAG